MFSLGIYQHGVNSMREDNISPIASFIVENVIAEAIANGDIEPLGGKDFYEYKHAYCRGKFTGQDIEHFDPLKKAAANKTNVDNGFMSKREVTRALTGKDIDQVEREIINDATRHVQSINDARKAVGAPELTEQEKAVLIDDYFKRGGDYTLLPESAQNLEEQPNDNT